MVVQLDVAWVAVMDAKLVGVSGERAVALMAEWWESVRVDMSEY